MKKSLILSTIMTLVLIVAMSTATFAWYSANTNAKASGMALSASTAAGNVKIGHESDSISYTSISWVASSPANASEKLQESSPAAPMMPVVSEGKPNLSNFATGVKDSTGMITYSTGNACSTYTFHLSNENSDSVKLTFTGEVSAVDGKQDLKNMYEWAIVIEGTIYASSTFDYLTATAKTDTDQKAEFTAANTPYTIATGATDVLVTVYVWFAGDVMQNSHGGGAASLAINIAQAQQQPV